MDYAKQDFLKKQAVIGTKMTTQKKIEGDVGIYLAKIVIPGLERQRDIILSHLDRARRQLADVKAPVKVH